MPQSTNSALVVYESRSGSTGEIAACVGDVLTKDNASLDVREISEIDDVSGYDRVVVGSAIRYDRWSPGAIKFVKANQQTLSKVPVAYFFTCLALAKPSPEAQRKAAVYAHQLWSLAPAVKPVSIGRFAGVLNFAKAPWPDKFVLRALSMATGIREGDYRDWQRIQAWAAKLRHAKKGAAFHNREPPPSEDTGYLFAPDAN